MIESDSAVTARVAQDQHRLSVCDQIEVLIAGVRDRHPDMPLDALANLLPERERERLVELLAELAISPFPVEGGAR